MYQYIPGMYQYIPTIRTEIHTKIHTNTEGWYWYVSVVLVRICTYQVSIRALHFPDGVIPFKTRLNWDIPDYPRLSFLHMQGYPVISYLVPSYPLKRHPRISQDIPRQDSCIGISHNKFPVLGYPGLSLDKHQVGLSRDIPGYPLWSFFQIHVDNSGTYDSLHL